jgi:Fic family protein
MPDEYSIDTAKLREMLISQRNTQMKGGIYHLNQIVEFHYQIEAIHPFQDGNGRVGRIILFEQCLKSDILPFIVLDDDKFYYYRGLSEYTNEKGFLRDTFRSFQDKYHAAYRDMIG